MYGTWSVTMSFFYMIKSLKGSCMHLKLQHTEASHLLMTFIDIYEQKTFHVVLNALI